MRSCESILCVIGHSAATAVEKKLRLHAALVRLQILFPLVSVIIPAFNRETTIARSVGSALNQTYSNLEVIVVDDGSRDGTLCALEQFAGRITVVSQENAGPSRARNLGASQARGTILAFLDSDDEWLPHKIERQVRLMQGYGDGMPCCICNAAYTDVDGQSPMTSFKQAGFVTPFEVGVLENPAALMTRTFVLFNQVVAIRRESFEQVGGYKDDLRLLEDYELSLRLSTLGPWGVLSEPLVLKHEDTVGIGVATMRDELKHLSAQAIAFQAILANPSLQQPSIRKPILAALKRARRQQSAHRWILGARQPLLIFGHAALLLDRVSSALARRMPGSVRYKITPVTASPR
jgi:glycosyltransferase involved in cell wall biosynthesis